MKQAIKISDNIYWVGGIDWKLRSFHGYITQRGSTYNAYLIVDEKVTLIDTTKYYLGDELLERISSVIDPSKIDYIISNHVEPDHSGAIPQVLKIAKNAKVITSFPAGQRGLNAYYGELPLQPVKSGETLSLGKYNLQFIATPMVHWPDNMVTYLQEEQILFSNDAFGQHYASCERFDDEANLWEVYHEAEKYYANIVQPYCLQVQKVLAQLKDVPVKVIAPSHGIIWRSHIPEILKLYGEWANFAQHRDAVIVYDTMWQSTELMAHAVLDAFEQQGIPCKLMDVQNTHLSDIMTEVMSARYIVVGSPVLNNQILPTVASFVTYFKGLNSGNHRFLAFGSYGWNPSAIDGLYQELAACKLEPMLPAAVKLNFRPTQQQLESLTKSVLESLAQENA